MKLKHLLFVILLSSLSFIKLQAQADVSNAQAVFIYNFLSHIKWPDSEVNGKYVIGVYGKTKTLGYLKSYTMNRKVGNKSIEVVNLSSPEEAKKCNVIFVSWFKSSEVPTISKATNNKSCLIITEKEGTLKKGAVVEFRLIENKLRYKLNQQNAKDQNLFVSQALVSMSL